MTTGPERPPRAVSYRARSINTDVRQDPYGAGYRAAITACRSSSIDEAWALLDQAQHRWPGYLIGFRMGIRDYERANLLAPSTPPLRAYGFGT